MNFAQNLLAYSISPVENKAAGDKFFKWLDLAVRSVVDNKVDNYPEIFPIYENNEETRNMLQELSAPLQRLEIPSTQALEKLTVDILGINTGAKESSNSDEEKFANLIKHILVNQIYENGFSNDDSLNEVRESLLEHL